MSTLLVLAIFLPLGGALALALLAPLGRYVVRWSTLAVVLATLVLVGVVVAAFPARGAGQVPFAVFEFPILQPAAGSLWDVHFRVGLDGLGVWLFGLTGLLMVTAVLVSWEAIQKQSTLFYAMLLMLEFGCLGVFAARDLILFYIFFEFTLIPLFFLIGIWGSEQRRYAAYKFFLFTLAGSVLTLVGLVSIVLCAYRSSGGPLTLSIDELKVILASHPIEPLGLQMAIFLALFAGFAIKVPLFPLHTWLPLAHVQAPTAGSVFLAGILLKIGVYGFLQFSLPMLPAASAKCMPWILWLAVIGILYGALVALVQRDVKRLVAFSSVSHMGLCILGLFALNRLGLAGGTLQMVNHGISTGALFALVGMLYERYHTREIQQLGGLSRRLPWLAFFMVVFAFSSIAVPGLNGFVGEWLILSGMFQRAWLEGSSVVPFQLRWISVLAMGGVVLGAWYMLWMIQRVFFGPLREPDRHEASPVKDLSLREILALAPLAVFVVWIGVHPQTFLDRIQPALEPLAATAQASAAGRDSLALPTPVARDGGWTSDGLAQADRR